MLVSPPHPRVSSASLVTSAKARCPVRPSPSPRGEPRRPGLPAPRVLVGELLSTEEGQLCLWLHPVRCAGPEALLQEEEVSSRGRLPEPVLGHVEAIPEEQKAALLSHVPGVQGHVAWVPLLVGAPEPWRQPWGRLGAGCSLEPEASSALSTAAS